MSDVNGASGGDGNFKAFDSKFMGRPQQKTPDQKLRDVSDMYEKHFLREMMKAMRSTVHEGGFVQSNQAEKIFKEQLDDHYVEKWGERGGIGLSDMIYKQLLDKFGVMMGIKAPVAKPQGPLPMDAKSEFRAQPFQHPGKKQSVSYRIDIGHAGSAGAPDGAQAEAAREAVKAPWDGVLLGKKSLADNQTMVEIEHDNGLKSQMVFKGGVSNVSTGQKLQAGDTLGFLSPEAKSLYWTVEPGPETVSE
ncbi:rod-binding protein [Bdellovibrio bacteriovorus]|uniref:rod-binding protein n=1 Tax=Bdellovibrio bacteriovorus TaxID=959 RepID=UPI0035A984F0